MVVGAGVRAAYLTPDTWNSYSSVTHPTNTMQFPVDDPFVLANLLREVALFGLLIGAVYGDLSRGRIFNALTFPATGLGLVLSYALGGTYTPEAGLLDHFLALMAPIAIFGIPYAWGWFGAGDVKLLAAIGALKGLSFVLTAMLFTGLAGGALALAGLATRWLAVPRWSSHFNRSSAPAEIPSALAMRLPYGLAIAAGTTLAWFILVL